MLKLLPVGETKPEIKLRLTPRDDYHFADFKYPNGVNDRFSINNHEGYKQVFDVPRKLVHFPWQELPLYHTGELLPRRIYVDQRTCRPEDLVAVPGFENFEITEIIGGLRVFQYVTDSVIWYNFSESPKLVGRDIKTGESRETTLKSKNIVEQVEFGLHLGDRLFHYWGKWDRVFPDSIMPERIMREPWQLPREKFEKGNEKTRAILEEYYPDLLPDTPSDESYCLGTQ
jgi:hypothetical protein